MSVRIVTSNVELRNNVRLLLNVELRNYVIWLPSKTKITLANLAKVDTFLLAKSIFF